MSLISNILKKNRTLPQLEHQNENAITGTYTAEEEEIVAAITVSIACITGISPDSLIVRNIKRVTELDSIWTLRGTMKLMR